jgi:hypothetical protein
MWEQEMTATNILYIPELTIRRETISGPPICERFE